MILHVPWILLSLIAYVVIVLSGGSFETPVIDVQMISGADWVFTLGDALLAGTLFLLFIEILKATRTGGHSVVDHALSMIVFIVCLIMFLIWPHAGTSLFFFIMLVSLIDVIAGFSVTIRGARRDMTYGIEGR